MTCPGWFNMELCDEAFSLLATVGMITVKILLIFIAAVARKTYSSIKIMQAISPNFNWENGVKQVKITEENSSKSCILCQLLRAKTLVSGSNKKMFITILPDICWVDVIYLICLVFLKSPWWLVWIFCAPTPLTIVYRNTLLGNTIIIFVI